MPQAPRSTRAVRFARALALLSSGALGCGSSASHDHGASGDPEPAGDASTPADASVVEAAIARPDAPANGDAPTPSDASLFAETSGGDAQAEAGDPPTCAEDEYAIDCPAGSVCYVDQTSGSMQCQVLDSDLDKPCGAIACGWLCACSDPSTSSCFCYVDSGPLPPPEEPRALRRARQARGRAALRGVSASPRRASSAWARARARRASGVAPGPP